MTDELRIAVCKAMGWHCIGGCHTPDYAGWVTLDQPSPMRPIPPLTLELMWQAEEMLSEDECRRYNDLLADIAVKPNILTFPIVARAYLFHASAEQRAEAFLKVKGVRK